MTLRGACVSLLLATACGASGQSKHATTAAGGNAPRLAPGPARFRWKAPFTVHVSEDATKDKSSATLSYWLDVCPKAPDLVVISHRDFKFVTLGGKPASSPELAATIAQLEPLLSAIPRFTVDARGAIVSVEGVEELLARLRAAAPNSAALDGLTTALQDPNARIAIETGAAERWALWVKAWLDVKPGDIPAADVVGPHRVRLTQSSHVADMPDPSGSGAVLTVDLLINTDTEWPNIRPWTASSMKALGVALNGEHVTRTETHRFTFDWAGRPGEAPACVK
jgi:hypothetical protein